MPRHAISLSGVRVPYFDRLCESREICKSLRWEEIGKRKAWDEIMPFLHTKNNIVENNEVERVLQKLGDGAGINVTGAGEVGEWLFTNGRLAARDHLGGERHLSIERRRVGAQGWQQRDQ